MLHAIDGQYAVHCQTILAILHFNMAKIVWARLREGYRLFMTLPLAKVGGIRLLSLPLFRFLLFPADIELVYQMEHNVVGDGIESGFGLSLSVDFIGYALELLEKIVSLEFGGEFSF